MKFNSTKLRNRFIRSNSSLDHVEPSILHPNWVPSVGGESELGPLEGLFSRCEPHLVGGPVLWKQGKLLISSDWIPRHFFSDEKSFWIEKWIWIFFYRKNKHLGLFLANLFAIFQNKNLITNSKNVGPEEPISGLDFALELIFLYIR